MSERLTYSDLLRDSRWQRKRLEVLTERGWKCEECGSEGRVTPELPDGLHVHHGYYERGRVPWEYDNRTLWVLCGNCHTLAEEMRAQVHRLLAEIRPLRLRSFVAGLELQVPARPTPALATIDLTVLEVEAEAPRC